MKNPLNVEKGEDAIRADVDKTLALAVEGAKDNVTKDFLDTNKNSYGEHS